MGKFEVKNDYYKERLNQIEELEEWAKRNTNYNKISSIEAIKFFDSDKENLSKDLEQINRIYSDMIDWSKSKFKIGNYTAMEHANIILLRRTDGHDIKKIREQLIIDNAPFTSITLSTTAKINIIQKTLSKILKDTSEQEAPNTKLVEWLVDSGNFKKEEAIEAIEKALKIGAITSPKPGYVSL